jgi:hypothetical protein
MNIGPSRAGSRHIPCRLVPDAAALAVAQTLGRHVAEAAAGQHALGFVEQVGDGSEAVWMDMEPCRGPYSMGTKMEWRILPSTACEKWPLPCVSSTSSTSPAPMMRFSPSLAVIETAPSRLMMYCRRGAGCQS